ncbi:MAG: DUF58 domain-containing protein [Rariglobus sp.]
MSLSAPNSIRAPRTAVIARPAEAGAAVTAWQTTSARKERTRSYRWRAFMWSLVYPYRGNRLLLTLPGGIVIAVAMGIGAAAYNTANNILFITLSLLLACLVFGGLLSWLNLKNLAWRLRLQPPLRVGRDHTLSIELHNRRHVIPAYGIWFEVNMTGGKKAVRLPLRERLDAQDTTSLDWTFKPTTRGQFKVELLTAGSLFPFGFLKKMVGSELKSEALVWPATVEYQRFPLVSWHQPGHVERSTRVGQGGDLLALRNYARGDSNRLVHWKASARLRRLMVRQYAAETQVGFSLWVQTSAAAWPRPEQFELMCSLAGTMADDLFRAGRLSSISIDDDAPLPVRRMQDLEHFLDRLARVAPGPLAYQPSGATATGLRNNVMTFAPDGSRGVLAYVDGQKAASA